MRKFVAELLGTFALVFAGTGFTEGGLPVKRVITAAQTDCCTAPSADDGLHRRLMDLLRRYNMNEYAASVKVFALKAEKA